MRYIIIILLFFLSYNSYAQDPSFSQVDMNTMYMNPALCGSGGNTKSKAWKDIWGSGQGIGSIKNDPSVQELVNELTEQYEKAYGEMQEKKTG